ncbi:ATP-binding cassette domain-containing protein [Rhodobacteraceae bacterium NNCM2]|nr:ATP-binding cassette domain-containing protein [Coraliihabitans acroporae]
MISLNDVSFGYDGRETLEGLTAEISPGSFHFLTGPSGAGKTTLLKMLYLEHMPWSGKLEILGMEPDKLSEDEIVALRRRIGVVFQEFRLLDHISVAENIALPLRISGKRVEDYNEDVQQLVKWVGLTHRMHAHPPQISAGEKQRAAIARAVVNSPDLILADEPTGNVDPEMGARILRLLVELNRLGKTVLIATHDLGLIRTAKAQVQARILRLADGQLSQGGSEL